MFRSSRWLVIVFAVLCFGGLAAGVASAASSYYVVDLGYLNPAAPGHSYASAINFWGDVVGSAWNGANDEAFLWTGAAMTGLGTLNADGSGSSRAMGMNNAGQVVGASVNGPRFSQAFLWTGTMTALPDQAWVPLEDRFYSGATAINDGGQIVGWTQGIPLYEATVWENGIARSLGLGIDSKAYGINNKGQVVGWSEGGPFLWSGGTSTKLFTAYNDLGEIAGDINESGQVVGRTHLSSPPSSDAVIWDQGAVVPLGFDLPASVLPEGDCCVIAINNTGQVVGSDATRGGVMWDGGLHLLSSLLDASGTDWTITAAADVNDRGQIAATALGPDGLSHAVRLDPTTLLLIDIMPGTAVNPINPKSKGKITVAVLSTRAFSAPAEIDQLSLRFGRTGDETSLAFCDPDPVDADGDGTGDLVCHFYTQSTGFHAGDMQGVMKAKTVAGVEMAGADSVRTVPRK